MMRTYLGLFFVAALGMSACAADSDPEETPEQDVGEQASELKMQCYGGCISGTGGASSNIIYEEGSETFYCDTGNLWTSCDGGNAYCSISWCDF
jgi:hypothetical protein